MKLVDFPWVELSIVVPLLGAACVGLIGNALSAARWSLGFAGGTLACAVMACACYYAGPTNAAGLWGWTGRPILTVDELNAPLLPLVALLHFLTALATARTKMGRFSFSGLLADMAVRMAVFACAAPWALIGLLALEVTLPVFQRRRRGSPQRLYVLHAGLFVLLLLAGWGFLGQSLETGSVLLLAAALVRTGAIPAQVWVTDAFEHGSFGSAILFATPLTGAYAAVRLVVPVAPEWALEALGIVALGTAVYAAGMGLVQTDARRFFAYLFVSHAALVLVGLGLHTPFAVTGSLVMWVSSALSLAGLGLTLRAVEARVGPLDLTEFRGLYDQSPGLAVCFLVTGLAAVGFPFTSGFVAIELLVDEAVGVHLAVGLVVVLTAAVNGIGVVRAYLLIFTGRRHTTGVNLGITTRERVAVLTLAALLLGGGLVPQAYLESRHRAAAALLRGRAEAASLEIAPIQHGH
jgi:NADH-quinone oxidoreductase subunit M